MAFSFPAKEWGRPQYPTPYSGYVILTEPISIEQGSYKKLNPLEHHIYEGRDRDKYPFPLYLVKEIISDDGRWAFRFWANDRNIPDQNQWNYGIAYGGQDNAFPYYVRQVIVPRDQYVPLAKKSTVNSLLGLYLTNSGSGYTSNPTVTLSGTNATAECRINRAGKVEAIWLTNPGTTYTPPVGVTISGGGGIGASAEAIVQPKDAILVKEEMRELPEDHLMAALHVQVLYYYETLPGPWFITQRQGEDGKIVSSRRRHNLLEDIVAGETISDDKWTQTLSEPVDDSSWVSWEIQHEYNLPDSDGPGDGGLDPDPQYDNQWLTRRFPDRDGIIVTERRRLNVRENITPKIEFDETNSVWIEIKEEIIEGRESLVWEIMTFRELPGNVLHGQRWDKESELPIPYTIQLKETHVTTDSGTTVEIIDQKKYLHRTELVPEEIDNYLIGLPSTTNLPLPDELIGLSVEWIEDSAEGSFNSDWQGLATIPGSLSGSESGNAHSSGSLIPSIVPNIQRYWGNGLPTIIYFYYLKIEDINLSNILSKLNVSRWPVFKPKSLTFVLKGGKVSVQANAQASASARNNGSEWGWDKTEGVGTSYDLSPLEKTVTIAPTLHGSLSLSGDRTKSLTVDADAEASWSGENFPTVNAVANASKELDASVTPTSVSATSPSAIPKSGKYLLKSTFSTSAFDGYMRIASEVIDASIFN